MSVPFKTLPEGEDFEFDEIYKVICSFDPEKDPYCETILQPKNGEIYLHFSKDAIKADDWKADGIT